MTIEPKTDINSLFEKCIDGHMSVSELRRRALSANVNPKELGGLVRMTDPRKQVERGLLLELNNGTPFAGFVSLLLPKHLQNSR